MGLNFYGRRTIYTDERSIDASNVVKVLLDAVQTHNRNREDIDFLERYEKGEQPILGRVKEVRPEICNRIVENHAAGIVNFKTGYLFGSPVSLVQRADKDISGGDPAKDDARVGALNEMLAEQNKASKDQELAHCFCTAGVGYRLVLPKRRRKPYEVSVFDILTLNPKTTFLVYSNNVYREPLMGVTFSESVLPGGLSADGSGVVRHYGVYTAERYFEIKDGKIIANRENPLGCIPIVEYHYDNDMMGAFEKVIPLLDALNLSTSNRLDCLEQFVQSVIVLLNTDAGDALKDGIPPNAVLELNSPTEGKSADAKILSQSLNQTSEQTYTDYLLEQAESIAAMPGKTADAQNSTGEAVLLSNGWQLAETSAKSMELVFKSSERRLLEIILSILALDNTVDRDLKSLKLADIEIKFSRNRTDGLLTKVQALQLLLASGIKNKHAFEACGLWSDVQTVWDDSKESILEEGAEHDKPVAPVGGKSTSAPPRESGDGAEEE